MRPRRLLTLVGAVLTAGAVWFLTAPAASAHALVVSSDPSAGQSLTELPKAVTVTFSEEIVPKLSGLQVVDSKGHQVNSGPSHIVKGNALQLTVPLPTLRGGVYTVQWHTVSSDDGHHSSGTFTFGVGPVAYAAMSGPAPALVSAPSSASPATVTGTWIFDTGLGLLAGGCWIALFGYPTSGRRTLLLALGGGGTLLAGLAVTGWAQANSDHIGLGELASTSLGLGLFAQAIPGAAAAACIAVALRLGTARRRAALGISLVLAAGATAAHVLTTHAASGNNADFEIVMQWLHVAAFATWIGGLAALLLTLGAEASPLKAAAVRRFSKVAGYSLLALVLSGVVRALDEVGAWTALADTLFGRLVLVKLGLVAALATLGGYNRYRSVPAAANSLTPLRRVGTVELGLGALALVAAATLSSSLPPSLAQAAASQPTPPHLTVDASTAGVRASLEVSPGYPGTNRFTLRAYDAASGHALTTPVTLTFSLPSRPDVAPTTLDLVPTTDGSLTAIGDEIGLTGQWAVKADLNLPKGHKDVPFTVGCALSPQQIEQMTMGRMVMLYGIQLTGGRQLEAYLTPARPGRNTLHVLFTDQRNAAITMSGPPTVTVHRDGSAATRTISMRDVVPMPITRNNYFGDTTFTQGRWDFHLTAQAADGTELSTDFTLTIS
ncbi:MAG TPA: copper resistance protein CopC [Actinocrinis sp.]|jgi:copper transport protein|uniref:copper resistance CopC/CopD family protein n=1 Tax=Actinocrinis sp. TaxID=1920516 RepID=UPI002DDCE737|nr:copper resistance protein CopC [Actinocrinis sp.]HEV3172030.1 copper resistance protein CopC [Actinocrinis sp.]